MIKKKSMSLLVASILVSSVLFTGCQDDKDATKDDEVKVDVDVNKDSDKDVKEDVKDEAKDKSKEDDNKAIELSHWDGTWNNMGAYLEDEEIQGAYEGLAKKENMTKEEAKEMYITKRKTDFDGMVIKGNNVKFLDGFEDKDGKEIAQADYEFKETKKVPRGDSELVWHVFESNLDSEYKVLAMMEVDDEEALTHFHMRYGKDLEEILAKDKWFPTLVKPDSTSEQLIEEIAE